jgi:hypothetical protein
MILYTPAGRQGETDPAVSNPIDAMVATTPSGASQ